ncbi:butyrophilin-like protein 1 [Tupaia chinensis]|uniref:butyrophilin-like protein 1 n=1 Tax=Tupaia chinensis TaxID=246437 RepID=UPI0003C8E713|nr:butyrophilin-like protein 1 [Tupaia chinensis]
MKVLRAQSSELIIPCTALHMPSNVNNVSRFSVKGPVEPIVALLGADATLPCQVSPEQSAAHMHIRWYRTQLSPAVLVVQNGQEQGAEQMLEYRGRTKLVRDSLSNGAVALQIQHIRASDHGQYRCYFKIGDISEEAIVELNVIGLGSAPHVYMAGVEEDGIRVLCSSDGWFPKPTVKWRNMAGVKLPSPPESQTQDGDGLFRVEASLVVTDSSLGNVTCTIQNPLSGQEKAAAIFLPEPFFPRMNPWKAALAGTLPVLGILLIGISYFGWREHQAKEEEITKKEKEAEERDQMVKEKEEALTTKANLTEELESRKALYKEDWKKALLYPDWRKELFQSAKVTINYEPFRQINSDPEKNENGGEETHNLPLNDNQEDSNLITLDQEDFMSGRYYWEVDLPDADEWTLGMYEKCTGENGPSKIFRVLEKKGGYRALTCPSEKSPENLPLTKNLQKIVIFLDYGDGDISFYDMSDGAHIFSFTKASFSGPVYPYLTRKSMTLSPSTK